MDAIDDQVWWSLVAIIAVLFTLVRIHEGPVQSATLLIGKAMAPPPMPGISRNNGLQDALTYDHQKFRQILSIICGLLILIVGFQLSWYVGPIVLIVALIVSATLSRLQQKPVIFYVGRMIEGLQRRRAKFIRKNDTSRAEACEWFEAELNEIYDHLYNTNPKLRLPSYSLIHGSPPSKLRKWLALEELMF